MRFQSLDLNMGDNYVDKHRKGLTDSQINKIAIYATSAPV